MGSPDDSEAQERTGRGKGRGGKFFAVDREIWGRLWAAETGNRFNFVATYLVLSAGTGSDHRLTKWSTKACEQHVGIGKPRAKVAIEELIGHDLVKRTEQSTPRFPQYELQPIPLESEPIFLPLALVTGIGAEASLLRRMREAGDALLLRMLIDLYGMIQLDATFGVPISALSETSPKDFPPRKVFEIGVHAIWALRLSAAKSAAGDWAVEHRLKSRTNEGAWAGFWERVTTLERIGALWFEPWVFDSEANDAEPLFPVDLGVVDQSGGSGDVFRLTTTMMNAAAALSEERANLLDRYGADVLVTLSQHRQAPGMRGVARLRVEADTPGRRLSYYKRRRQIEVYQDGYTQIERDAIQGDYSRPMNTAVSIEPGSIES
ncbi:hypothetical protein [Allosphingosinicella sp.]|uniref:hypothetical protein n=1 Tax=Allosphingosinicella sp. TaxID=2823234 RepID=UPI003784A091